MRSLLVLLFLCATAKAQYGPSPYGTNEFRTANALEDIAQHIGAGPGPFLTPNPYSMNAGNMQMQMALQQAQMQNNALLQAAAAQSRRMAELEARLALKAAKAPANASGAIYTLKDLEDFAVAYAVKHGRSGDAKTEYTKDELLKLWNRCAAEYMDGDKKKALAEWTECIEKTARIAPSGKP